MIFVVVQELDSIWALILAGKGGQLRVCLEFPHLPDRGQLRIIVSPNLFVKRNRLDRFGKIKCMGARARYVIIWTCRSISSDQFSKLGAYDLLSRRILSSKDSGVVTTLVSVSEGNLWLFFHGAKLWERLLPKKSVSRAEVVCLANCCDRRLFRAHVIGE